MNSMHDRDKARQFASIHTPMPASIGELLAMSGLSTPCCGHIALCDGACRDTRPGGRMQRDRHDGDVRQ